MKKSSEIPIAEATKIICDFCDRATDHSPETVTDLLRQLLTRMPDEPQQALAVELGRMDREKREAEAELKNLKDLQNTEA